MRKIKGGCNFGEWGKWRFLNNSRSGGALLPFAIQQGKKVRRNKDTQMEQCKGDLFDR